MIKGTSLPLHSFENMSDLANTVGPSYRYYGYVIDIRTVISDGPCPSTMSEAAFKLVKNDFLITISREADGSGVLSYRQILEKDVKKYGLKKGDRLYFLQKRGCVVPDGLHIALWE
jgi:hypothetical protein